MNLAECLTAAKAYCDAARAALAARARPVEEDQRAAHGFAWVATSVAALESVLNWRPRNGFRLWKNWSGREDSNLRPPHPQCDALPGCATSRPPRPALQAMEARLYGAAGAKARGLVRCYYALTLRALSLGGNRAPWISGAGFLSAQPVKFIGEKQ